MEALEQVRNFRKTLPAAVTSDETVREAMLLEARKLLLDLEEPQNIIARIRFQHIEAVACSIAIKSGIFKALKERSPQTTAELAAKTGVDPLLLERVLRCLSSYGAVGQDGIDSYRANKVSNTLSKPTGEAAIDLEFHSRGWPLVPSLLQRRNWTNITDGRDTPLTLAWNMPAGSDIFRTLNTSPHMPAFFTYLTAFDEGHKPWIDFYPVMDRLKPKTDSNPDDSEPVIMVDVGGGLGHQLLKFKQRFGINGRYIVQDFAHAFPALADREPGVEYMEHDFTTEQPVKGALVYYMRYVPHDWSQEVCTTICTRLREAMTPGYSRVIVNEWVVPEVEPSMFMTSMDLTMMAASGGMERTERLHRGYLEGAGLTVTGVWEAGDKVSEGVIEAMVV